MKLKLAIVLLSAAATLTASNAASVSDCKVGAVCVVEGRLNASNRVGSVSDASGCIAVALPESVPEKWNGRVVRVEGGVYAAVNAPGLVTYKLRDRTVDAEACASGPAMYVDRIDPTGDH